MWNETWSGHISLPANHVAMPIYCPTRVVGVTLTFFVHATAFRVYLRPYCAFLSCS